jgi:hypothetical protein
MSQWGTDVCRLGQLKPYLQGDTSGLQTSGMMLRAHNTSWTLLKKHFHNFWDRRVCQSSNRKQFTELCSSPTFRRNMLRASSYSELNPSNKQTAESKTLKPRNVGEQQRSGYACRVHHVGFFIDLLSDCDDGKNTSFRNVVKLLQSVTSHKTVSLLFSVAFC